MGVLWSANFSLYLLLLYPTLLLMVNTSAALDLCTQSFCQCPDAGKEVHCRCVTPNQELVLDRSSVPQQTIAVNISECGEVRVQKETFAHCLDLRLLTFTHLRRLQLQAKFYSSSGSKYAELTNLTLSHIGELILDPDCFVHLPKVSHTHIFAVGLPEVGSRGLEIITDTFVLENSHVGKLSQSAIYSDAADVVVKGNRIEQIQESAFDASVRRFWFVSNTVDAIHHNGLSVACLEARIADNIFADQVGSPFNDFGPDPACMPDPDQDEAEEDIIYNVVSNPRLVFNNNSFLNFDDTILNFPGANNVPLGNFFLSNNQVKCVCSPSLTSFVRQVDFEYLDVDNDIDLSKGQGELIFRKHFYDTSTCWGEIDKGLKAFARLHLRIDDNNNLVCSDKVGALENNNNDYNGHPRVAEAPLVAIATNLAVTNFLVFSFSSTLSLWMHRANEF